MLFLHSLRAAAGGHRGFAECSPYISMVGGEETVGFEQFGTFSCPGHMARGTAWLCPTAQERSMILGGGGAEGRVPPVYYPN